MNRFVRIALLCALFTLVFAGMGVRADVAIASRGMHVQAWQSLSVTAAWAAGNVQAPTASWLGRWQWLLAVPIVLFVFYLVAWMVIGPEPRAGTVVTRYEPPERLSAAGVRYTVTTGSDGRSLAAVIATLAVRGCVRVEPQNEKYKLSRMMSDRAAEATLAPEEKRVLGMLFEDGPEITLTPSMDQGNTTRNTNYVLAIQQELSKQLGSAYFTKHTGVICVGVVATIACALGLAATTHVHDVAGAIFLTIWVLFAGLITGVVFEVGFLPACRTALRVGGGWMKLLPATAALGIFGALIIYMLKKLAEGVSPTFGMMVGGLLVVNLAWGPRLKRRTQKGREVLDQIAGFKMFLEKTEKDRLDRLNSAGDAAEMLDEHLPYAIALEVREAWGDHLAGTFMATTVMR